MSIPSVFVVIFFSSCLGLYSQNEECIHVSTKATDSIHVNDGNQSDSLNRFPYQKERRNEINVVFIFQRPFNQSPNTHFSNLNIQYNFLHFSSRKIHKGNLDLNLLDEMGYLFVFDSIQLKTKDMLRLSADLSFPNKNQIKPLIQTSIQTQKFPSYELLTDSLGNQKRVMQSYLSNPGYLFVSSGFNWEISSKINIDLGLAGLKFVWMADRKLFEQHQTGQPFNIFLQRRFNVEGGLQFKSHIRYTILKKVNWEHFAFAFLNIQHPENSDIEIRNNISLPLSRTFKINFLTKFSYSVLKEPHCLFEGEIGLGFSMQKVAN